MPETIETTINPNPLHLDILMRFDPTVFDSDPEAGIRVACTAFERRLRAAVAERPNREGGEQ